MEKPSFLPEKYKDLPGSKPVERAVTKKIREGEKGPTTKEDRVEAYLDRIDKIVSTGTHVSNEKGWELLKHKIIKEFTLNANNPDTLAKIAHGLYESEKKLAIEQGRGTDVERLEQDLEQKGGIIERYKGLVKEKREIQEKTLTDWLHYLKQNDAQYPMWFRYFVVRNLQKMGTMDKERGEYTKRTPFTVAHFPELNSEALGFVYRMLAEGMKQNEFIRADMSEEQLKEATSKQGELQKLIDKKDFIKLYTFAQIETASEINRESIEGQWVKYDQGSNHHVLENALRGKGTGWCTAEGSAYAHLQGGDFYVYFTKDQESQYAQPRIAIRTENGQVVEVRGVNHRQELEPTLVDIAQEEYHALPGGERFDKKSVDMRKMTKLVQKQEKAESFTKEDLTFLYEMESTIEGFGYEKDPRIAELRGQRSPEQDMLIIFECTRDQVAKSEKEINETTKAYVGKLDPGILDLTQQYNIEHIYTSFPEGKIKIEKDFEAEPITLAQFEENRQQYNKDITDASLKIKISDYSQGIMQKIGSPEYPALREKEKFSLVHLKVSDLFQDENNHTTEEIYQRAQKFGLELCPSETGPLLRLQYLNQPMNEWIYIGMKQIADRDGNPSVFRLGRDGAGLWLYDSWARPDSGRSPRGRFVFRLRKRA